MHTVDMNAPASSLTRCNLTGLHLQFTGHDHMLVFCLLACAPQIPPELVINDDQAGINLVPVGKRTWAKLGAKTVRLLGVDDKRQLTLVVGSAASGKALPFQVIFQGKTPLSLPPEECCKPLTDTGAKITHTGNHWANLETSKAYVQEIVVPYCNKVKASLGLPAEQKAIQLLDMWKVHVCKVCMLAVMTVYGCKISTCR